MLRRGPWSCIASSHPLSTMITVWQGMRLNFTGYRCLLKLLKKKHVMWFIPKFIWFREKVPVPYGDHNNGDQNKLSTPHAIPTYWSPLSSAVLALFTIEREKRTFKKGINLKSCGWHTGHNVCIATATKKVNVKRLKMLYSKVSTHTAYAEFDFAVINFSVADQLSLSVRTT